MQMDLRMKNIFATIITFLYIYPLKFVFLPAHTRLIFAVLGCTWLVLKLSSKKVRAYYTKKELVILLILIAFIIVISLISLGINNTLDISLIRYAISCISTLFAGYFIITSLIKCNYNLNYMTITLLIVNVIFLQSILATTMYLSPEIKHILYGVIDVPDKDIEIMARYGNTRIFGLGSYFFGAGVINGLALIMISVLLKQYQFNQFQSLLLLFKYLIILIIGMSMARTTIIGICLSLYILLLPKINGLGIYFSKKNISFTLKLFAFPIVTVVTLLALIPQINLFFQPLFTFAFEMFINLLTQNNIRTASTDHLTSMYIFPESIKTWIIGDGLWNYNNHYYMKTDVGYLRLIYYFGLSGLIVFLTFQCYLIFKSLNNHIPNKKYYLIFLAYLFILNLKGFVDLTSFMSLFFISYHLVSRTPKQQIAITQSFN